MSLHERVCISPTLAAMSATEAAGPASDLSHLAGLLAAERAHATRAWTILSELGLHGLLPDWARQAGAGSHDPATGQEAARLALDDALERLLPGFADTQRQARGPVRLVLHGEGQA